MLMASQQGVSHNADVNTAGLVVMLMLLLQQVSHNADDVVATG